MISFAEKNLESGRDMPLFRYADFVSNFKGIMCKGQLHQSQPSPCHTKSIIACA